MTTTARFYVQLAKVLIFELLCSVFLCARPVHVATNTIVVRQLLNGTCIKITKNSRSFCNYDNNYVAPEANPMILKGVVPLNCYARPQLLPCKTTFAV